MADPDEARRASPARGRPAASPFTHEETVLRVGRYRWVEMKLFEALGGWVATVPELDVKVLLATHAHHHAFHAGLWHDLLPARSLTGPAAGMDDLMAAMTEPRGPSQTIEKLVGVYRVLLPHTIAAYTYHLRTTSDVADQAAIRTIGMILRDELDDWREAEMHIQSLLTTGERVERAAACQVRLERLMVAAGGIAGPGSVGGRPSAEPEVPAPPSERRGATGGA